MAAFFSENLSTILIAAVLVFIVGAIVIKLVKDKRKGKSVGCNCGCKGCPSSSMCHKSH